MKPILLTIALLVAACSTPQPSPRPIRSAFVVLVEEVFLTYFNR